MKIKEIIQSSTNDCGACCIAMIMNYYQRKKSALSICQELEIGRDGIGLYTIKKYFEKEEFRVRVLEASFDSLKQVKQPSIISYKENHFVVLEKLKKNTVIIIDPIIGRTEITSEEFISFYNGYILEIIDCKKFKRKFNKPIVIGACRFIDLKKRNLLFMLLISSLAYIITVVIPIIVQYIVDDLNKRSNFNLLVCVCICAAIVYTFLTVLEALIEVSFGNRIFSDLYIAFMKKIFKLKYSFFQLYSEGNLLYKITSISMIETLITRQLLPIAFNTGVIFILLIYSASRSIILTFLILIGLFANFFVILFFQKKLNISIKKNMNEAISLNNILVELLDNITSIKMQSIEEKKFDEWSNGFKKFNSVHYTYGKESAYFNGIISSLCTFFPIGILAYGCNNYNGLGITIGTILGLYSTSVMLFHAETTIFILCNEYSMSKRHLEQIIEIMEQEEETLGNKKINSNENIDIIIDDICFSYGPKKILKNININIPYGKTIAIVGPSGSGKSTLLKLLTGLLDANSGKIQFNSILVKEIEKKSLNSIMSIVPQDLQLYNGSIMENLQLDNSSLEEDVYNVCERINLKKDIDQMPMGYNTILTNPATNISGGQKQKIGIAAAILKNPKILLLDESTSSLDSTNESVIFHELEKLTCTKIIVAHRLSTIQHADYIYVMDDGNIIEEGKHNDLLKLNGKYASLYLNQT